MNEKKIASATARGGGPPWRTASGRSNKKFASATAGVGGGGGKAME